MYHLTFTRNQKDWKKNSTNIFLGKAELPGKLDKTHSDYKFIIPNWHWDNVSKLEEDYQYIDVFYEKLIKRISYSLNEIHNEKWSLKSWKILIGPWLRRYLIVLFDRIENIKYISNYYDLKSFTVLTKKIYDDFFPTTFDDFQDKLKNENFNVKFNSLVAEKLLDNKKFKKTNIEIEKILVKKKQKKKNINSKEIIKSIIKSRIYNNLFSYFLKKNKFYFHELQTNSNFEKINLFWKLKNFPHLGFNNIDVRSEKNYSKNLRNKLVELIKKEIKLTNFFEICALDFIFYFIPECYLESFQKNKDLSIKEFRFIDPIIIIDQTSYHKDEIFKFWLAQIDKSRKKILLIQHGGEYEVFAPENDFIKQELEISNIYLSWGWKKNNFNVFPISCPISFKIKKDISESTINVILRPFIRFFSGSAYNDYGLSQKKYLELVLNFLNSLNEEKTVNLCFHPSKLSLQDENEYKNFILENFKNKKNFNCVYGLKNYINFSSFNIFTYLGTPFDQAISSNIPSMVLTSDSNFLNKNYQKVFDSLQKSKILHTNPDTLINHLNNVSNKTLDWWNKDLTQQSRKKYCSNFACSSEDSQSIFQILKKL